MVKDEAESEKIKQHDKHATVDVLKKQNITFFLDDRKLLLMFLQLIPLAMVNIVPKNMFDTKKTHGKSILKAGKNRVG